jgi:DeoR/GlpR family transcriptional regulator of sugar metabolism
MSSPQILPEERQRLIIERLHRDGRVVATELAREYGTSEDTIRRDLRDLAAAGVCRRVYGGALPLSPAVAPLSKREKEAPERKAVLADRAAELIKPGQIVFFDAGSTNAAVARSLPLDAKVTVVTNAVGIAADLAMRQDLEVLLIGGRVDWKEGRTVGARTVREIMDIRPDLYFLGTCAIDAATGVAVYDHEVAELQRLLVEQSGDVVVVATTEKLGTSAPFTVVPCADVTDLVVEATAPQDALRPFLELGLRIHRAAPLPDPA